MDIWRAMLEGDAPEAALALTFPGHVPGILKWTGRLLITSHMRGTAVGAELCP